MKKKAIFFDRDGIFNQLVFNVDTGMYEPPHQEDELSIFPGVVKSLKELSQKGYLLFCISNQPGYALGRTSEAGIIQVEAAFKGFMVKNNIPFQGIYYCHHHPNAVVETLKADCLCRKPKPYLINKAAEKYELDKSECWMVGDSDIDVFTGESAGVKTILQEYEITKKKAVESKPNYRTKSLDETVETILKAKVTGKYEAFLRRQGKDV